jgi:hypothetical protein
MTMLYAPQCVPAPAGYAYAVSQPADLNVGRRTGAGFVPGGTVPLSHLQVGETDYRLRRPVQGTFVLAGGVSWEFWVEGFSPLFIGQGPHAEAAYLDWRDQVHVAFQDLYRKRPFEMTQEEREKWTILEDLIDVVGYRNETPVLVRQLGQVTQGRPWPRQITWVDGAKEHDLDLALMPDEFASYKPGQWFEAIVERDPLTWRMLRVRFVQRTPTINPLSGAELERYWASLPTTASLPKSKRDWTRR